MFFIINLFISTSSPIVCKSYHKYYEEYKKREIVESVCVSSTNYCVKAIYSDPDSSKMNGFSHGCDKNDCVNVGNPRYGWDKNGCMRNKDYGKFGIVCCCNSTDFCNSSNKFISSIEMFILPILVYIFYIIF
uniref:Activin_recp domain-containing protein n=1 Tax=Parastrongyloides trichosuri TaxID=131310 RepID=A0A0N5A5X1_PARTI